MINTIHDYQFKVGLDNSFAKPIMQSFNWGFLVFFIFVWFSPRVPFIDASIINLFEMNNFKFPFNAIRNNLPYVQYGRGQYITETIVGYFVGPIISIKTIVHWKEYVILLRSNRSIFTVVIMHWLAWAIVLSGIILAMFDNDHKSGLLSGSEFKSELIAILLMGLSYVLIGLALSQLNNLIRFVLKGDFS